MAKKWASTKMRGPKVRLPKQQKAKALKQPKVNVLADMYRRTLTANVSARINAFYEAIQWWDSAIPSYIAARALDASQMKKFEIANKVRTQAVGQGVTVEERVTFLEKMLLMYESIWPDTKRAALQPYLERYRTARKELEAKEAALTARFQPVIDALTRAFQPMGIEFSVQKSENPRQFDGVNKILLSRELAKTLSEKSKKEGLLPVVLSEANTVLKVAAIQKAPDGTSAMDLQKYYSLVPDMLQNIMRFCGTVERSKVFRACPETLEATPGVTVARHTPKAPRQPRPAGASPGPRVRQAGPLVGGRFTPGSAMAILYQTLQDQKKKALADVLKTMAVGDPLGRVKSMLKIGQQTGKWTVTLTKDSVQMVVH